MKYDLTEQREPLFKSTYASITDLPPTTTARCWNCHRNFNGRPKHALKMQPIITIEGVFCSYSCAFCFDDHYWNSSRRQPICMHYLQFMKKPVLKFPKLANPHLKMQKYGIGMMTDDEYGKLIDEEEKKIK